LRSRALVLHYDKSPQSIYKATGLVYADAAVVRREREPGSPPPSLRALSRENLLVLISPTSYRQRRAFYSDAFLVRPLLLRWRSLTADRIKRIMRISDVDSAPLCVSTMLNLLRRFQRAGVLPSFAKFLACVRSECDVKGQGAPLNQRLKLLESHIAESEENAAVAADGGDVETHARQGASSSSALRTRFSRPARPTASFMSCSRSSARCRCAVVRCFNTRTGRQGRKEERKRVSKKGRKRRGRGRRRGPIAKLNAHRNLRCYAGGSARRRRR